MLRFCRQLGLKSHLWKSSLRKYSNGNGLIQLSEEVRDALHHGKAVVALESTIITHGMPHPENLSTSLDVERVVRENGAVPATVGILKGVVKVGLSKNEMEFLADPSTAAVKTSRRDFPLVLSRKHNGGTTVSGTMVAAHHAGIPIFVTGGIGGVHRGAENTMDISADLTELGRTPVTVVSAGVKSILDIGRTLEYLETQGVCVASYGKTKEFPAFFTPRSGYLAPYNVENIRNAAQLIYSHNALGLNSGVLIAVPIPERHAEQGEIIEQAIQNAWQEARENGIIGKDVTPYILERVNQMTGGASLQANIHLIRNNADVGSKIAVELSNIRRQEKQLNFLGNAYRFDDLENAQESKTGRVVVIGGSIVDFYARVNTDNFLTNGGTYPGTVQQSFGGVGRNLADSLSRLNVNPLFISAVGNDSHKTAYQAYCKHMDLSAVRVLNDHRTATYCAVLRQSGELMFGIGDMDVHATITPQLISDHKDDIQSAALVCVDGNIPAESIGYLCSLCHEHGVPVWFEPTDLHKAGKPFENSSWKKPFYASPNLNELRSMYRIITGANTDTIGTDDLSLNVVLEETLMLCQEVTKEIPVLMVTLGEHGVVLCHSATYSKLPIKGDNLQVNSDIVAHHFPAASENKIAKHIVSVSGAGDCLNAGVIAGTLQRYSIDLCIKTGLLAAQYSLMSHHVVPETINTNNLSCSKVKEWATWSPKRLNISSK